MSFLFSREKLGENIMEESGMIPAHLLGMWPVKYDHLYKSVVPFPAKFIPDVTKKMKAKGMSGKSLFKIAEKFFISMGE